MKRVDPVVALAFATGILGLLSRLEIVSNPAIRIDAAVVTLLVTGGWMLARDWRLGSALIGVFLICYVAGAALPATFDALLLGAAVLAEGVRQFRVARHRE